MHEPALLHDVLHSETQPRWAAPIHEVLLLGTSTGDEQRHLTRATLFLEQQFGFSFLRRRRAAVGELRVDLADWERSASSLSGFDRLFESANGRGERRLVISSRDWMWGSHAATQLLNRYQRLIPAPTLYRALPKLNGILAALQLAYSGRELQPLVRRARASWRWAIRLCPSVSPACQLASLFQLTSPLAEPTASERAWSIENCLLTQARLACRALEPFGISQSTLLRSSELILRRDEASIEDEELQLLQDARDLAFFSNDSASFLSQWGVARTFVDVRRRLERMSEPALSHALFTQQPPRVAEMMEVIVSRNHPLHDGPDEHEATYAIPRCDLQDW